MKTLICKTSIFAVVAMLVFFNVALAGDANNTRNAKVAKSNKSKTAKADLSSVRVRNVEFGFNRAAVPESDLDRLDNVAKLMTENNAAVTLGGHTDNRGGYVYNWKLSQARAEAVKAYLVSKGADSARIAATEFGYTKPIASNKTLEGRKKNRRVDIKFVQ